MVRRAADRTCEEGEAEAVEGVEDHATRWASERSRQVTVKVYVAGSSAELERAQRAIDFIRSIGWEVVHDWVADVRRERLEGGRQDSDLSDEERRTFAHKDLTSVGDAELVWLLVPNNPSTGAWVELGYALALTRVLIHIAPRIIASGPAAAGNLFCSLLDRFDTDEDAMAELSRRLS